MGIDRRPWAVKAAIAMFLVDMALEFIDAYRYQYNVSPDYFGLFWLIAFPIFLISVAVGLFGLTRRNFMLTALAPMVLFLTAFYSVDQTPAYYRPPGWPTPIPQWIHLVMIGSLLALLFTPSSVGWYRNKNGGAA